MPTFRFFLYLLLLALSYLYRVSYSGWFGLYLFLAMITAPLLLLLLSLPSVLSTSLTLQAENAIFHHKSGSLGLCFSCRSLLPVGRVRIWLAVENRFTGKKDSSVITLYGVGSQTHPVELPTARCGQLCARVTRWECSDLLGLFSFRRKCPERALCTVLPAAAEPDSPIDFDASLRSAVQLKPKYGGGFAEEHDLREYRPGDSANSIHWKLSSKTDTLIVREALEQENREIFAVLSRVGEDDRGLEVLYWLSLELLRRELPHLLAADRLYPVGNEEECLAAFSRLLAAPYGEPCGFDAMRARCIFRVFSGEVRTQ